MGFGLADVDFTRELEVRDLALRQELALSTGGPPRRVGPRGPPAAHARRPGASRATATRRASNGSSVQGGAGLPSDLDSAVDSTRVGGWLQDRWQAGDAPLARGGAPPRLERRQPADDPLAPARRHLPDRRRDARCARAAASSRRAPATRSSSSPTTSSTCRATSAARSLYERATHAVVGLERDLAARRQRPGRGLLEGPRRPRRRPARDRGGAARPRGAATTSRPSSPRASRRTPIITSFPVNGAAGRSWGFDVLVQKRPTPGARLTGWASYTWGRAERRRVRAHACPSSTTGGTRRASWARGGSAPKWELGATVRAFSGFPRTPVLGLRVAADETRRRPARARARRRGTLRLRDGRAAASRTSTRRGCPPSSASTCASRGSRGETRGAGSSTST